MAWNRRPPANVDLLMRLGAAIRGLFLVLIVAACTPTAPPSPPPAASHAPAPSLAVTPTPVAPAPAAQSWTEPPDYAFTLTASCGERTLIGRFRVEVEGHAVARVTGQNAQGRLVARHLDPEVVPTLAGLIELVDAARASNAFVATLESDPETGQPRAVMIDRDQMTIDDEECYEVSDVVAAGA